MPDDLDRESDFASKADRIAAFWMDYHAERGQLDDKRASAVVKLAFNGESKGPPIFAGDDR